MQARWQAMRTVAFLSSLQQIEKKKLKTTKKKEKMLRFLFRKPMLSIRPFFVTACSNFFLLKNLFSEMFMGVLKIQFCFSMVFWDILKICRKKRKKRECNVKAEYEDMRIIKRNEKGVCPKIEEMFYIVQSLHGMWNRNP